MVEGWKLLEYRAELNPRVLVLAWSIYPVLSVVYRNY
jgi:hypothetical protein